MSTTGCGATVKTAEFLSRLQKVRKVGSDSWVACCPAHEDKHPSMTVTEVDERLLIHCFAGCGIDEIVGAVGMDLADLFPEKQGKRKRGKFDPYAVLRAVDQELDIILIVCSDIINCNGCSDEDFQRLRTAVERVKKGKRLACGS